MQTGVDSIFGTDNLVVDVDGKPLLVYHGTNAQFAEFDADYPYHFFATSRAAAEGYGRQLISAYLHASKLFDYEAPTSIDSMRPWVEENIDRFNMDQDPSAPDYDEFWNDNTVDSIMQALNDGIAFSFIESVDGFVEELRRLGFDGFTTNEDGKNFAVFSPGQIKRIDTNIYNSIETVKMKNELDAMFGTDEVLGVQFVEVTCMGEGATYSLAEMEDMLARLGREGVPDTMSIFPDGTSAITCTNYAIQIAKKLQGRVQIFGFANEDNPTSKVAREMIHPGGHDFAIVDQRYLVDPWVRLVAAVEDQIVYDFEDPHDLEKIRDIYGPRECWERMHEAEPYHAVLAPAFRP